MGFTLDALKCVIGRAYFSVCLPSTGSRAEVASRRERNIESGKTSRGCGEGQWRGTSASDLEQKRGPAVHCARTANSLLNFFLSTKWRASRSEEHTSELP